MDRRRSRWLRNAVSRFAFARITRRGLVGLALCSPFVALLGCTRSVPSALVGEVLEGEAVSRFADGALPVVGGGFARLGSPLAAKGQAVFSIANGNDRFVALVAMPAIPAQAPYLVTPAGLVRAESYGSGFGDAGGGAANFRVDLARANEVAGLWHVPRQDRVQLGAGLVGHFRPKAQPFKLGGPMEIVLEVENTGTARVGFSVGGQQSFRDDRFAFVVERDGKALPVVDASEGGGFQKFKPLAARSKLELGADLAAWTRIDAQGHYRVRCSYKAELVPGTEAPRWPDHGHETWDVTLAETIDILVN
jgi:hypothetical protein